MKRYFLKQTIDELTLIKYGFNIMETPVGTAAILQEKENDINSLIVILKPPVREVKHRYQNADEKLETLIKGIRDLVDERNV